MKSFKAFEKKVAEMNISFYFVIFSVKFLIQKRIWIFSGLTVKLLNSKHFLGIILLKSLSFGQQFVEILREAVKTHDLSICVIFVAIVYIEK